MKMIKSLILGSAAALTAAGGAQAADLPVKAKAVEYVKVCSLYGAGFYYIPGTNTCIKLGGYLRAEIALNAGGSYTGAYSSVAGAQNRLTNYYYTRSREDLNVDTRTATEYGVVRTFFDSAFSWTTDNYTGSGTAPGATVYSQLGATGVGAPANANAGAIANGTVGVYYAFIQFAGFTMGKAVAQFDAPWNNYPGNNFDGLNGGGGTVTGVNQFSYTAEFGRGISASVSAVDPTAYYQSNLYNVSAASVAGLGVGGYGLSALGGTRAPDIQGSVRVDQAWGLFQLSAAAHDNHAAYYSGAVPAIAGTELAGHPNDKWGWAVQAALSIKNIPTGVDDTINVQAVYTDGATRYNFQSLASQNFAMFGGSGNPLAYQSVGLAGAADGVFANGAGISSVQTWGMRGAYTHNWDPSWNTAIYGAYAQLKYGNGGEALICGAIAGLGAATAGITTCNPDFNVAQLGLITRWTPVRNLTFSADVLWTHLDQKYVGTFTPTTAAGAVAKPAATYELKDQNSASLLLRAQRVW
ncbi:porin [Bradyrhizobium sp. KBS0727]|uniref:porin n=1 Tax=unclassified Bradyrhizobium TaxID=2631580 RepID=UPI00110D3859|nr:MULTISPECIES: porin [unclassified Bradyrhizobium]QDW39827.1 porin [Bradyrhizobium sp. KBS0725]QDW46430.1 porin [Bradyrhizobium sp. KBS0727]